MVFLTGEYFHAIDSKSRLTIPARLREAINPAEQGYGFMAVRGFDGVLYLYTPNTFRQIAPQFDTKAQTRREVRDYQRLTYALAEYVEVDRLGRVLIPENTLRRCGLSREVAILGCQDHIEVWDRGRWEKFVEEQMARQDELAERVLSGEPPQSSSPSTP